MQKNERFRRATFWILCLGLLVFPCVPAQAETLKEMKVNGVSLTMESPLVLKNQVLMAPAKDLFASVGLHYYKHPTLNQIEGNSYKHEVMLAAGSAELIVDGQAYVMTQPVEAIDGIIMVPVRAFYEALGAQVRAAPGKPVVEVVTDQPLEEKLRNMLDAYVRDRDFRGTVLVAKDGRVLVEESFGMADESKHLANTNKTQYHVASLTKPFTAIAIAKLEEEGKLSRDDYLSEYFPDAIVWKDIQVKHLLSHTSGLIDLTDIMIIENRGKEITFSRSEFEAVFERTLTPDEQIDMIQEYSPAFAPGEKQDYSNSNYLLLGRIIEIVSGTSYQTYVSENLIKPAGMADTTFEEAEAPRLAKGHSENRETIHEPAETQYAYGSLISTVQDLYAFDKAMHAGILVKPETAERIIEPIMGSYGYGWNLTPVLGQKAYSHNGDLLGYHARMAKLIEQDTTIIILSNNQLDLYSLIRSTLTNDPAGAMEYMDQRRMMGYAEELSADIAAVILSNEAR